MLLGVGDAVNHIKILFVVVAVHLKSDYMLVTFAQSVEASAPISLKVERLNMADYISDALSFLYFS